MKKYEGSIKIINIVTKEEILSNLYSEEGQPAEAVAFRIQMLEIRSPKSRRF